MAPASSPAGAAPTVSHVLTSPVPDHHQPRPPLQLDLAYRANQEVAVDTRSADELAMTWQRNIFRAGLPRDLTGAQLSIVMALSLRADPTELSIDKCPLVTVGRAELMVELNISDQTVCRCITDLKTRKLIRTEHEGGGAGNFATYELLPVFRPDGAPDCATKVTAETPNESPEARQKRAINDLGTNASRTEAPQKDEKARLKRALPDPPEKHTLLSIKCNALNALQCNASPVEVLKSLTLDPGAAIALSRHKNCDRQQLEVIVDRLDEVRTTVSQFVHAAVYGRYQPRRTVEQRQIDKLPEHRQEELAISREQRANPEAARQRKEEEQAAAELDRRVEEAVLSLPPHRLTELGARALGRMPESRRSLFESDPDLTSPHWQWAIWQELQGELVGAEGGGR